MRLGHGSFIKHRMLSGCFHFFCEAFPDQRQQAFDRDRGEAGRLGIGGASEWFAVVAEEPGVLYVNTDGSSYDTVLGIYTYSPAGHGLALLGCDNNSGLDRRDSAVSVPVQKGQTNFVVIDGFNGASGVARLNCTLVTPGSLTHARSARHARLRRRSRR